MPTAPSNLPITAFVLPPAKVLQPHISNTICSISQQLLIYLWPTLPVGKCGTGACRKRSPVVVIVTSVVPSARKQDMAESRCAHVLPAPAFRAHLSALLLPRAPSPAGTGQERAAGPQHGALPWAVLGLCSPKSLPH